MTKQIDEQTAMLLAAISTVSFQNTRSSAKHGRIRKDNPYWTIAYQDVCDAIDREMRARERAEKSEDLLRRIADAGVIFPSMCANNIEAMNLVEALDSYRSNAAPDMAAPHKEKP